MGALTAILGALQAIGGAVSRLFDWLAERQKQAEKDKIAHDAVAVERGAVAVDQLATKTAMDKVQNAPHDAKEIDKRLGDHTF